LTAKGTPAGPRRSIPPRQQVRRRTKLVKHQHRLIARAPRLGFGAALDNIVVIETVEVVVVFAFDKIQIRCL
jgi:hypothetical protein